MAVDIGTGTTITFGTSAFTANILSVDQDDFELKVIDASHMGSVDTVTKIFGKLVDYKEFTAEFQFDPDDQPPLDGVVETITITFPVPSGGSTGAKIAASGAITKWKFGSLLEELMTGTFTVTWTTKPGWTAST